VDPLLCDPCENQLILAKAHNADSDWYAFVVMLMQSFLFVGPFGGVYRPKDPRQAVPHHLRPLKRITVFHPDVRYPKPAVPYQVLPDDLLHYFHEVFEKDRRGAFPEKFLDEMRWTTCSVCHTEHARSLCPNCLQVAPAAVKMKVTVRGTVMSTRVFQTRGKIICAAYQNGKLLWLTHENGELRRESGTLVLALGNKHPHFRFRLQGERTLIGQKDQVAVIQKGALENRLAVDSFGNLPVFDTNASSAFWIQSGQIFREDRFAPKYIGDTLQGQTLFWAGPEFGFGFYRAGGLNIAFLFDAKRAGVNDRVKLAIPSGQLIDATCAFSESLVWFFMSMQVAGKKINHCFLISREGKLLASEKSENEELVWLEKIRGKCAAGKFLFSPSDDGILRLEEDGGKISVTRSFPDTEPFLDSSSQLFIGQEGIYAVGQREIQLLKIS
jgi:H/ACA ribonucleoprotein complex subunit 3